MSGLLTFGDILVVALKQCFVKLFKLDNRPQNSTNLRENWCMTRSSVLTTRWASSLPIDKPNRGNEGLVWEVFYKTVLKNIFLEQFLKVIL